MAGTKEGARKAAEKNMAKDPNFYKNIGSKSWSNPERSRKTGFANLPREKHIELSRKGGKKTKKEYQIIDGQEYETAETLAEIFKAEDSDGPSVS